VLIAMAVMHRPRLLIADEPTSALDAISRTEVIDLLKELNQEMNMAVLLISHELLSIASLCRRVAILEKGEVVESGPVEQIFCSPEHPYTRALVGTLPVELPVFSAAKGSRESRTRIFKAISERPPTAGALRDSAGSSWPVCHRRS